MANSFAAVRAGARQIQGTLNGLGERCGNANLVSIIPTLKLKAEFADKFDIGVSTDALGRLARASQRWTICSIARPIAMRLMSVKALLPPRPAFTLPQS